MRELSPYVLQPGPTSDQGGHSGFQDPLVEEEPHLRDYWRVVHKHLRLIGASVFGVVGVSALVVFLMTPQYTAETTLLVERKAPQALKVEGAQAETLGPDEYDYYKTQYELLKSRTLASQVIQELNLAQHDWFAQREEQGLFASMRAKLSAWISTAPADID